jgi:uncharacterized integral membrane protein
LAVLFTAYVALFALWNQAGVELRLWYTGWVLEGAYVWQVALASLLAGLLIAACFALPNQWRLMRRVQDLRGRLSRAEAEAERQRLELPERTATAPDAVAPDPVEPGADS